MVSRAQVANLWLRDENEHLRSENDTWRLLTQATAESPAARSPPAPLPRREGADGADGADDWPGLRQLRDAAVALAALIVAAAALVLARRADGGGARTGAARVDAAAVGALGVWASSMFARPLPTAASSRSTRSMA